MLALGRALLNSRVGSASGNTYIHGNTAAPCSFVESPSPGDDWLNTLPEKKLSHWPTRLTVCVRSSAPRGYTNTCVRTHGLESWLEQILYNTVCSNNTGKRIIPWFSRGCSHKCLQSSSTVLIYSPLWSSLQACFETILYGPKMQLNAHNGTVHTDDRW